jgi:hypothetical protein
MVGGLEPFAFAFKVKIYIGAENIMVILKSAFASLLQSDIK